MLLPASADGIGIVLGTFIGMLLGSRLSGRLQSAIISALGLCALLVGIQGAVETADILCVIICMVAGTALGELLKLHDLIENTGERLKKRFAGKGNTSRFTEGFIAACVLYGFGALSITGSMEAGISGNYNLLLTKTLLDFVTSIAWGAAFGIGVAFSALYVFAIEGGMTLLASLAGNVLPTDIMAEMSAIGGVILIAMALNLLDLPKKEIKAANMMPAIFMPILYFPLKELLSNLF